MILEAGSLLLLSNEMGKVWTNMFGKSLGDKSKLTLKGILDRQVKKLTVLFNNWPA